MTLKKKRITQFDFSAPDSHVALVSKTLQSGPANGTTEALILKAAGVDPEMFDIHKAKVQVTLTFQSFLERFMYMCSTEAEVLSRMLGMEEDQEDDYDYDDYINEKVESYTILKSLTEFSDVEKAFDALSIEDKKLVLQDQVKLEALLKAYWAEQAQGKKKKKPSPKKGKPMADETIAKADHEVLIKAMAEQSQTLAKATETVELLKSKLEAFEAKEKENIRKGRELAIQEIVKDTTQAQALFKNLEALSDESFVGVLDIVKNLTAASEEIKKNSIFKELGASGEPVQTTQTGATKDLVAKALKKQFNIKDKE